MPGSHRARLTAAVRAELEATGDADPLDALRAIGRGYLNWALASPTHFRIVSSRSLIDLHGSPKLVEENEAIRLTMVDLIERGGPDDSLRAGHAAGDLMLASRAFIYGVARMWIDGHFKEWKIDRPPAEAMSAALDLFIAMIGAKGTDDRA